MPHWRGDTTSTRYMLINESEYSDDALAPLHHLVAELFRLENSATISQILLAKLLTNRFGASPA